ncbi:SDR family NAD(P)-dependent oxidoreductase [Bailinhaonella thermotolerans]|uniref:SDR family oxidoreductase n=1 Tax=Bailinhaonella thermotolerans TaxID=1070861 RepID=A0A3A4AZP5_9ACTN|nr:SDR family oxidoreductase [Bailinhaonella thermotolerans]RJL33138.1 SDR family oxidoreductase [Bailinhaonella thermotolerans]
MGFGLAGKVVLVTGASRGFGAIVARRLAGEGCSLALCARGEEGLLATAAEIEDACSVPVFARALDVTRPEELRGFVDGAAEALGGIDGLVANAGAGYGGSLMESTPEEWSRTYDINVGHAAHAIRCCVPYMRERGHGDVVIVSSISGWKPARRAQYGAAKAAEIYLAGSLARELAPEIRVNTVSPGSMLFPGGGWDEFRTGDPEGYERFRGEFPGGELVDGEDAANVVVFLLSRLSWAVNGANIPVDAAQNAPSAGGY